MQDWNERGPRTARTMNRKKKTAKWCKGKQGVEHVPEVVVNHNLQNRECKWFTTYLWRGGKRAEPWRTFWSCSHATRCANCGKYINYLGLGEDCPDYVKDPE